MARPLRPSGRTRHLWHSTRELGSEELLGAVGIEPTILFANVSETLGS